MCIQSCFTKYLQEMVVKCSSNFCRVFCYMYHLNCPFSVHSSSSAENVVILSGWLILSNENRTARSHMGNVGSVHLIYRN